MRYDQHAFTCTNAAGCAAAGGEKIQSYLKSRIKAAGLKQTVRANKSGCLDACEFAPVTLVYPDGIWYRITTEAEADAVFDEHLVGGAPVERLMIRELNPDYAFSSRK